MIIDAGSSSIKRKSGFVVLEGINGAGKGSVKEGLIKYLKEKKIEAVFTFEPGGSTLGKELRPLILGNELKSRTPLTELLLVSADRSAHLHEVVLPALSQGKIVISDRYYYSTVAFQSFGRGLELDLVNNVNQIATGGIVPDLMILLDLDPVTAAKRTQSRSSSEKDVFEDQDLAFHKRIREGFLTVAKDCKESCVIIDASQPLETVISQVLTIVEKYLS